MAKKKKHINTVSRVLSSRALCELVRTTEELHGNGVAVKDRKIKQVGGGAVLVKANIVLNLNLLSKPTRREIKQHFKGRGAN